MRTTDIYTYCVSLHKLRATYGAINIRSQFNIVYWRRTKKRPNEELGRFCIADGGLSPTLRLAMQSARVLHTIDTSCNDRCKTSPTTGTNEEAALLGCFFIAKRSDLVLIWQGLLAGH